MADDDLTVKQVSRQRWQLFVKGEPTGPAWSIWWPDREWERLSAEQQAAAIRRQAEWINGR